RLAVEALRQAACRGLVEDGDVGPLRLTDGVEVAALRDLRAVERGEPRLERGLRREASRQVPVRRGAERHPLALALDDEAHRRRLHPAGGQALADLAPAHLRHRVAEEAVDDAAALLGVDEAVVDVAG